MGRLLGYVALLTVLTGAGIALRPGPRPAAVEPPPGAGAAFAAATRDVELDPEVCPRAGYLCVGLRGRDEPRVTRWNDARTALTVLVPVPAGIDPARAHELQRAAVRGVRAWHRQPFPLRVETSASAADPDMTVTWRSRIGGTELGMVRTRWFRDGDFSDLEIAEFLLATEDPADPNRGLTPAEVQLAAAHEMGHALGLPHSDASGDVMYPSNTAARLSVDDYRTVETLYALPNGAVLKVEGGSGG